MINVINYKNESSEKLLEKNIAKYYDEVREVLPKLPQTINIYFGDYGIIPETGVGGFAYSHDTITLSIDPNLKNKDKQLKDIRSTMFHEALHVYQNYTGESGPFSAIENAVYEGMATVFEREYCGNWQSYGDYREVKDSNLKAWLKELLDLSDKDFQNNYRDWKFYHPKYKQRWIVYITGSWLVDQVLKRHKLTIKGLVNKNAKDILALYYD